MNRRTFFTSTLGLLIGSAFIKLTPKPLSKLELVHKLMQDAINAHDDLIEAAIFNSTNIRAKFDYPSS